MTDTPSTSDLPFGRWLLAKEEEYSLADELAFIARDSSDFPRDGSPDDVRAWLKAEGGRGDVYKAVDEAEREWKGEGA